MSAGRGPRRTGGWLTAALVALTLCLVAACSDGQDAASPHDHAPMAAAADTAGHPHGAPAQAFAGGIIEPRRAAPPLMLADASGAAFDLTTLRGRPVLVTFVYSNCPDVCPLIMQRLKDVHEIATRRHIDLNVVAVSVDPEGDTAASVNSFLRRQRLTGFVRYLIGDRAQLQSVWADWGVATSVPVDDPELIEHTALIYGVTGGGELATAYPVEFDPQTIAGDLVLLAGQ